MRLGNDHTSGTAAGKIAPLSSMGDNDYAPGRTAIFIRAEAADALGVLFVGAQKSSQAE